MEQFCSFKEPRKGRVYYLHKKEHCRGVLYYFSYEIIDAIPLPVGYEIFYNTDMRLPYIRKKK